MSWSEFVSGIKNKTQNSHTNSRKEFAIHIPDQIVYTYASNLEEAEEIACDEYQGLHDSVTEVIKEGN